MSSRHNWQLLREHDRRVVCWELQALRAPPQAVQASKSLGRLLSRVQLHNALLVLAENVASDAFGFAVAQNVVDFTPACMNTCVIRVHVWFFSVVCTYAER